MDYPELRVSFHQHDIRDDCHYSVELNCVLPGDASDDLSGPFALEFDWTDADSLSVTLTQADSSDRYGRWLTETLFRDAGLRAKFAAARARTAAYPALRLRLWLTASTPRLHGVLWERLQDPDTGVPLSTDERIHLSRFLSGGKSPSLRMRPRDRLSALVVIANPQGLDGQHVGSRDLGQIDVAAEWSRAEAGLQSISVESLFAPQHASLQTLFTKLRDRREGFDILYLVCHGAVVDGEPLLWLENEVGGIERVQGARLAAQLRDMSDPPRLVVLASCQSAGLGAQASSADHGGLAALAPRLAAAGVPAIIAMQSDVRMDTASRFFARFFAELLKDSQIDRAVTIARAAVSSQPDWWVPVLITRLKFGRIWAEHGAQPGFSGLGDVAGKLGRNSCTPIIGPDLVTGWTGSPMKLAQRWSELFEFPMAPRESDSLPQVAQYLAYHRDRTFLTEQLSAYIREHAIRNFPAQVPPEAADRSKARLVDVLAQVWHAHIDALRRQSVGPDPVLKDAHWLLARMPFPVYITTNRDGLLAEALREAGKHPEVEVCRWRVFEADFAGWPPSVFETDPHFRPSVERPLVFHAFGHMAWPETLVLTEDNFFDYLIGITRNEQWTHTSEIGETGKAAIPAVVRTALSWRSLLFLGFRISDWEFRALFRRILAQEQSVWTASDELRRLYKHVAVQLDPASGGEYIEPEGAREYLTDYFGTRNVSLQWGTANEYIEALHAAWKAAGSPVPSPEDLDKLR
ncbi:MAG: CHAT domain-containing protein [Rubrivivax sp.]|nr:CHAT domain-containing protein [Rubrivivax sp.]